MRIVALCAYVCLALAGAERVNFYAAGAIEGNQNPEPATAPIGTNPVGIAGENRSAQENSPPKQERATATLGALSADIQKLWLAQKDAVVKVMGVKKSSDGQENLLFGTGFFADQDAHVLTTATIATDAETLWIEYGGLSYAATVIGKDPVTNIAVVHPLKKPEQFQAVAWPKTPAAAAETGSIIVSIGSAFGMEPAPTLGLVAGKNIVFGDRIFVTTYLRSNIAIHGGESGAPILSSSGNLCGMLIASLPELHASFSIPVRALERIFKDLISNKTVKYCAAGFSVRGKMSDEAAKEIMISAIDRGKIRYIGSETLEIGDVIRKIDGQKIVNENDIADILFFKNPNDRLDIQVTRCKKPLQVAITLSEKNF